MFYPKCAISKQSIATSFRVRSKIPCEFPEVQSALQSGQQTEPKTFQNSPKM